MTLEEFGASLREERERKGISLEDVSAQLMISVRVLEAMEQGDKAHFPHMAYAKGFLRSYANYLKMDAEEIAELMKAIDPESMREPLQKTSENTRSSLLMPILILVGAVVLILGIVFGFGYMAFENGWASSAYNWVAEKIQSFRKGNDNTNRKEAQKIAPLSSSLDTETLLPPSKPKEQPKEQPKEAPKEAPQTASSDTNDPTLPITDAHQVVIIATEPCWVHSTADNTNTRQFSLRKGDTFALAFQDKLEIKLGNAGGVRFRYNGQEIAPLGKPGQVKTVVFPLEATE